MNPVTDYIVCADYAFPDIALTFWMLGVAMAHAWRFVRFDDPKGRQFVAGAGVAVYLIAAAGAWFLPWVGYLIAIVFPFVGLFAVLLTRAEVDDWQFAVGVTQFSAVLYSVVMLIALGLTVLSSVA